MHPGSSIACSCQTGVRPSRGVGRGCRGAALYGPAFDPMRPRSRDGTGAELIAGALRPDRQARLLRGRRDGRTLEQEEIHIPYGDRTWTLTLELQIRPPADMVGEPTFSGPGVGAGGASQSSSQQTLCWRKRDSNHWSPVKTDGVFRDHLIDRRPSPPPNAVIRNTSGLAE
jgi:hypothetical protein